MPDSPTQPPPPSEEPTRPSLRLDATVAPAQAAAPAPTVPAGAPAQPPIDPALGALVAQASADLAQRQSVAVGQIAVLEARSVTWPDPGLGCPKPGMAYIQVPVDGVLIRLSIGGAVFSYHGGGGTAPFLCEQAAQQPAPPPGMNQ